MIYSKNLNEGTSKKDINKDISITHKAGWQLH